MWVFIPKVIQWHIHTGSWSIVNCWWEGSYEALYKRLMNINEMAIGLMQWLGLDSNWCMRDTQHPPFSLKRGGFACMQRSYYKRYSGPERTEYLNVLQGNAYKKSC